MNIAQKIEPMYRIDYTGCARAYDKYTGLRDALKKLCRLMRDAAQHYEAAELEHWMSRGGGFTRPHTPYYVTLSQQEYKTLMLALREHMPDWYARVRYYGRWI